ncbi:MAG: metallophosphoesterase [Prevotella sp.]|jgi:predicted MPP superfamily phosphohydrolase|nr:metallophosphoesterase [Prevotella sp.]
MVNKKRLHAMLFSSFVLILVISCGLLYAYTEARNIKLKEMAFSSESIPDAFDGKKIIFISDIHAGKYFPRKDVAELVRRINERNPDIILLGGDNTDKNTAYSTPFFEEIARLKSKYGIFSVLGNHDYWEDPQLIQEGLINCGFNICDNQSYWIKEGNDSIKIGGVGDLWEDVQIIENTTNDVRQDDFCILLSHNPDYMELLNTDLVDLMLSGHTHGGQVTLFGLYAPIMPSTFHSEYLQTGQKYRYGWKEKNNTKLYVTTGIGTGKFPLRFFAQPEIVEITLKKK